MAAFLIKIEQVILFTPHHSLYEAVNVAEIVRLDTHTQHHAPIKYGQISFLIENIH